MREITKTIPLKVFDYKVIVVVTDSILASRNKRHKTFGSIYKGNPLALCTTHGYKWESYVFIKPSSSPGIIAHECWHAVRAIFKAISADIDEELVAYHLEYLVDKAYELQRVAKKLPKPKK